MALRTRIWSRSSRRVIQTQNQAAISTKAKAKKTRFLSASPPQVAGVYAGFGMWAEGCAKIPRPDEEEEEEDANSGEEAEKAKV